MLLAIDAGNTNIVFAVFEGRRRRGLWRISTQANRTADEYAVWLTHLMALVQLRPADINDAILASVVPPATFHLDMLCRTHFQCEAMVVGAPGVNLGLKVHLDTPEEVGADRLVNAIAAQKAYKPPLIVVDFGTATTFDVVDAEGGYRGGVIAPGINLSLEALFQGAAKLPKVDIGRPDKVIGTATVSAMKSGIFWGYVGLIEGVLTRIKAEFGAPMTVIATGGLAVLFSDATSMIDHTDSELTLNGLLEIYERNKRA